MNGSREILDIDSHGLLPFTLSKTFPWRGHAYVLQKDFAPIYTIFLPRENVRKPLNF